MALARCGMCSRETAVVVLVAVAIDNFVAVIASSEMLQLRLIFILWRVAKLMVTGMSSLHTVKVSTSIKAYSSVLLLSLLHGHESGMVPIPSNPNKGSSSSTNIDLQLWRLLPAINLRRPRPAGLRRGGIPILAGGPGLGQHEARASMGSSRASRWHDCSSWELHRELSLATTSPWWHREPPRWRWRWRWRRGGALSPSIRSACRRRSMRAVAVSPRTVGGAHLLLCGPISCALDNMQQRSVPALHPPVAAVYTCQPHQFLLRLSSSILSIPLSIYYSLSHLILCYSAKQCETVFYTSILHNRVRSA